MDAAPAGSSEDRNDRPPGLDDGDLPATYQHAARTRESNERRLERYTAAQLLLFCLAAACGAFTLEVTYRDVSADVAGLVALVAFFLALILELMLAQGKFDEWRERTDSAAEAVESLAWRYAVGGAPFGLVATRDDPDEALIAAISVVTRGLRDVELTPSGGSRQMTPAMTALRKDTFDHRRAAYKTRLERKRAELEERADESRRRRAWWERVATTTLVLGLVGAMLKVLTLTALDVLGVAAAIAAAATAWLQTKRYRNRALDAGSKAAELTDAIESGDLIESEWLWSEYVQATEETSVLARHVRPVAGSPGSPGAARLERQMTWDQFYRAVDELDKQIRLGPNKFDPDVILAVNPGGAIVGGLLYFLWQKGPQFVPISYRWDASNESASSAIASLTEVRPKAEEGTLRILVIDASLKSGLALKRTLDLVEAHLPEGKYECRSAVLVNRPDRSDVHYPAMPTYFVDDTFDAFPYGPV